jgi:hypothetical protein
MSTGTPHHPTNSTASSSPDPATRPATAKLAHSAPAQTAELRRSLYRLTPSSAISGVSRIGPGGSR